MTTSPLGAARLLWRKLPWGLRAIAARAAGGIGVTPAPLPPPPRAALGEIVRGPIVVSGFFRDRRGVSQAARLTVAALRGAGREVVEHDITYLLDRTLRREPFARPAGGVWIVHCNPTEAVAVMDQHRELSDAPLYRIGAWAWELPAAPPDWLRATGLFHEIWGPSAFCAEAFSPSDAPVRVMPHPIPLPPPTIRAAGGPTRFAAFADLRSGAARKNPVGAVSAYLMAFPVLGDARLTVKLLSPEADPVSLAAIAAMIADRADIDLITDSLGDAEMQALYASIDVMLSLHRSEGFGLPIAQAMAAAKAVAATGWSGNLEFMTGESAAQRTGYRLVPVFDPSGAYVGGEWAEPDIDAAARLIRALAADADLRARLGVANRDAIARINQRWTPAALAGQAVIDLSRASTGHTR